MFLFSCWVVASSFLPPLSRPTSQPAKPSTSMPGGPSPRSWGNESRRTRGATSSKGMTWSVSSASTAARESRSLCNARCEGWEAYSTTRRSAVFRSRTSRLARRPTCTALSSCLDMWIEYRTLCTDLCARVSADDPRVSHEFMRNLFLCFVPPWKACYCSHHRKRQPVRSARLL